MIKAFLGRIVKAIMVVVVLGYAVGLLLSLLEQAEAVSLTGGGTVREWAGLGFCIYLGIHLLLYRPVGFFQAGRKLFSALAVWLFGSQVASVDTAKGAKGGGKSEERGGGKAAGDPQGSTLVAFSPYVVPLYTVLLCAAAWLARRWVDRIWLDGPVSFAVGLTLAFHWLMTADELQQQRKRWHVETYLLALSLVFVLTLFVSAAVLPWAVPEFSFLRALAESVSSAQTIYTTLIERLFL